MVVPSFQPSLYLRRECRVDPLSIALRWQWCLGLTRRCCHLTIRSHESSIGTMSIGMTQVEIRLEHIPDPLLKNFELGKSSFGLRVQVSRASSSHNLLPAVRDSIRPPCDPRGDAYLEASLT